MDLKTLRFLEDLAEHIAHIDSGCDHCINGFLNHGVITWDDEEPSSTDGGVNRLLLKYFPGFQYEHTRSRRVGESTVVRLVSGEHEEKKK